MGGDAATVLHEMLVPSSQVISSQLLLIQTKMAISHHLHEAINTPLKAFKMQEVKRLTSCICMILGVYPRRIPEGPRRFQQSFKLPFPLHHHVYSIQKMDKGQGVT